MSAVSRQRNLESIVAPTVTFAVVVILVAAARFYDRSPIRAPECGFKTAFGIPCVGCGGTRSMIAFAHGDFIQAVKYNPAVVLGIVASIGWLAFRWIRLRRPVSDPSSTEKNRTIKLTIAIVLALLLLNWLYLILFLK